MNGTVNVNGSGIDTTCRTAKPPRMVPQDVTAPMPDRHPPGGGHRPGMGGKSYVLGWLLAACDTVPSVAHMRSPLRVRPRCSMPL
jgi:hypothetical protein